MTLAPLPDLDADPGAAGRGAAVDDLDAVATLRVLESTVTARRRDEVADLLLCLHWADLHGSDPRDDPGAAARGFDVHDDFGRDRLALIGGEGTPMVRELSVPELGIARRVHPIAARKVLADALDLRHRLPLTFGHVLSLAAEPWVARKVAAASRHVSADLIDVVDAAVSAAITGVSPSRVEAITQAAIIEADPLVHRDKVAAERARRHVSLTRSDESGLRSIIARVTVGDAAWIDATLDRVADILIDHPDHPDLVGAEKQLRRSAALGWLARPAELLTLLLTHTEDPDETDPDEDPEPAGRSRAHALGQDAVDALVALGPAGLARLRPKAVLYVHLHHAALQTRTTADGEECRFGVARLEGGPPIDIEALAELLAHADVAVTPVVDLAEGVAVDAYEFPQGLRERIHLTQPADAFPHASRVSRTVDIDHPRAWRDPGPPGQTGTHNAQPLSRTPHRAKTHLGYTVMRVSTGSGPPAHLWRTPHGLHRLVDHTGTHLLTDHQVRELLNRADWVSDFA